MLTFSEWVVNESDWSEDKEYSWLPLSSIKKYEKMAREKNVSEVARSSSGFLGQYKRAGGNKSEMSEKWRKKRHAFISRHEAQRKEQNAPLFENGEPTRRHLALIMWAYSPSSKI